MNNPGRSLIKRYETPYGEYAARNPDVEEPNNYAEMYDVNVREPVQAAGGSNGNSAGIENDPRPTLNASNARTIDNKTVFSWKDTGQMQGELLNQMKLYVASYYSYIRTAI